LVAVVGIVSFIVRGFLKKGAGNFKKAGFSAIAIIELLKKE